MSWFALVVCLASTIERVGASNCGPEPALIGELAQKRQIRPSGLLSGTLLASHARPMRRLTDRAPVQEFRARQRNDVGSPQLQQVTGVGKRTRGDRVEHHVVPLGPAREILPRVVDHGIGPQILDEGDTGRAAGRDHLGPQRTGDLDGEVAFTALCQLRPPSFGRPSSRNACKAVSRLIGSNAASTKLSESGSRAAPGSSTRATSAYPVPRLRATNAATASPGLNRVTPGTTLTAMSPPGMYGNRSRRTCRRSPRRIFESAGLTPAYISV